MEPKKATDMPRPSAPELENADGGRSQPTGKPDVDQGKVEQGKNEARGARPGQTQDLQNEHDGGRTQPVQESGERITPPHGDELAEVAHDSSLDQELSHRSEGAASHDRNAVRIGPDDKPVR
ncbi:MAG: hypothetical protein ABR606_17665 [Vicinamibacterales bacterium]